MAVADSPQSLTTTVTFGEVEIRNYGKDNTTEEIVTYPLPNIRLVHRRNSSGTYSMSTDFLFTDLLGSVRRVMQGTTTVEHSVYEPFGVAIETISLQFAGLP